MNENPERKAQAEGTGAGQAAGAGGAAAADKEPDSGMSRGHVLDLKLPIGWLLSFYGVVLGIYGLVTKKEVYEKSLGLNVNLAWGALMLVIGSFFLLTALLKKKK
jgi:hypothetical protein